MKSIVLDQEKTIKQQLFGGLLTGLSIPAFLLGESIVVIISFITIGVFVLGFNTKIKVINSFENSEKQFCVFNFKLFSSALNFPFPEYVSLFSTTLNRSNEYGAVSAIGRNSNQDKIVLKLFKANKNINIYSSNSYHDALEKANFIKDILNVDLYNPINDNE